MFSRKNNNLKYNWPKRLSRYRIVQRSGRSKKATSSVGASFYHDRVDGPVGVESTSMINFELRLNYVAAKPFL